MRDGLGVFLKEERAVPVRFFVRSSGKSEGLLAVSRGFGSVEVAENAGAAAQGI